MSAIIFNLITLCLVLASPDKDESKVIGALQPIMVAVGNDAILPCHVEPPLNLTDMLVKWMRLDMELDPGNRQKKIKYVHQQYGDDPEDPDDTAMKLPSYKGRTSLFVDGPSQGTISLKITNVTLEDTGSFKCILPQLKVATPFSIVNLTVEAKISSTPLQTSIPTLVTTTPETLLQTSTTLVTTKDVAVKSGLSGRDATILAVIFPILLAIVGVIVYFHKRKTGKQTEILI